MTAKPRASRICDAALGGRTNKGERRVPLKVALIGPALKAAYFERITDRTDRCTAKRQSPPVRQSPATPKVPHLAKLYNPRHAVSSEIMHCAFYILHFFVHVKAPQYPKNLQFAKLYNPRHTVSSEIMHCAFYILH